MALLTDEELLETLETQLPALLKRHPEMEQRIYRAFMRTFVTKEEVAAILSELRDFRGEFDVFQSEVNERFEKVDKRFEKVDKRFEQMDQRFSDLRDWVEMVVGRFQTRSGKKLEDVVAGTMRLVLGRDDISSENVRLRQPLEDVNGMIGPAGRSYEVDILVDNSTLLVFEVKSACDVEDVDRFADKVALMRTLHPEQKVEGAIVTMAPLNQVEARCVEWDIALVR